MKKRHSICFIISAIFCFLFIIDYTYTIFFKPIIYIDYHIITVLYFIMGICSINVYIEGIEKYFPNMSNIKTIIFITFYILALPLLGIMIWSLRNRLYIDDKVYIFVLLYFSNFYLFMRQKNIIVKYSSQFKISIYIISGAIAAIFYFIDFLGYKNNSMRVKSFFSLIVSSLILCRMLIEYYSMKEKNKRGLALRAKGRALLINRKS